MFITVFGQTRALDAKCAQWLADVLEAEMKTVAHLRAEIMRVRSLEDLHQLQYRIAEDRINSILSSKRSTDLHLEGLEMWTKVRGSIP